MKTTSYSLKKTLSVALIATLVCAGAVNVLADNTWDSRHHYRRDNYGYYDGPHYHHYETWHNHHGYWDTRGSSRIFINVD
jgi:hypothetical protein